jgi:Polyketide cyclase / dehydrase and lipid transport
MTWIVIATVGAIVLCTIVATAIGSRLPPGHRCVVRAQFASAADRVWQVVTQMSNAPNWRSGLRQIERLPDRDGKQVWVEVRRFRRMPLVFEDMQPPSRLVIRIDDESLPYGGSWTYEIVSLEDGCTLTITEDGVVRKPLLRFMSRYLIGYDATIRRYLRDLGKKLGEKVEPERLAESQ